MTAYLLTPEQHAQIVDALQDGIKWLNICDKPRECMPLHKASAMLKAMKPSTPVAYLVYDPGACSQDLYFEEELGDMDGNSIESR